MYIKKVSDGKFTSYLVNKKVSKKIIITIASFNSKNKAKEYIKSIK